MVFNDTLQQPYPPTRILVSMSNVFWFIILVQAFFKNIGRSGSHYPNNKNIECHAQVHCITLNSMILLYKVYISKMYFGEMIWSRVR